MPEEANPKTPEAEVAEAPTLTLEELKQQLEVVSGKYERSQKDLTKFRTRADEVEASKKALEDEALKQKSLEEQIEALSKRAQDAEAKATASEQARVQAARTASLTGRVADPKAALKLLDDDHLTDDGDVNVDALLAAYPFLAPADAARPGVTAANPTRTAGDGPLGPDAFRGKSQAWIAENLHRLKPPTA